MYVTSSNNIPETFTQNYYSLQVLERCMKVYTYVCMHVAYCHSMLWFVILSHKTGCAWKPGFVKSIYIYKIMFR